MKYEEILKSVRSAVKLPENLNKDGSVNWNFVDADVFMEVSPSEDSQKAFYELFNQACIQIEMEMK